MSNGTVEAPLKTISTQEVRQLLDSKRPFQFWNVLTDEWFKGENIAGSRRVPLDKVGLRRPGVSAEPHGSREAGEARLRKRPRV